MNRRAFSEIFISLPLPPTVSFNKDRSFLKKIFSHGIGVESLSQVLDILEYACGLILGLGLISNENPHFEIVSTQNC
jgi:hypothetical protein